MRYIVELELGVYIAPWGRTTVKENAKIFTSLGAAYGGIAAYGGSTL